MRKVSAARALTQEGWTSDVTVTLGGDSRIAAVEQGAVSEGTQVGVLLPAPTNLHSHAFQRAMAGLTERRGPGGHDSFWTWRTLMYRFLAHLGPDDIEAIAGFVQMEMLEAGFGAVCEFHYLHHQPDGTPYDDIAETSARIAAASATSGLGLVLLPVLYEHGGVDGRPLGRGQRRFGNDPDRFARLFETARAACARHAEDATIGVAPHSLRAVSREGLAFAAGLAPRVPLHLHIAEQTAEVDEIAAAWGRRPVEWLLDNHDVGPRWCLVHATHMEPGETDGLAASGAVAGLCPVTEANLGDGTFDGVRFLEEGGTFGVGSDSNIRVSLVEELRTLEYSQRLRDRARARLAVGSASTGRSIFECALRGGAQAAARDCGRIEAGRVADLVALDAEHPDLAGKSGDDILDAWIFAGDGRMITDVWSAGRHLVERGRHIRREAITERYRSTLASLREHL